MDTSSPRARARWADWVGLACRAALAIVMLYSGVEKSLSFAGTVQATKNFQILPDALAVPFGYALPIVEIAVGLLALIGLFTRAAALVDAGLMVAFIGGIISVWVRGIKIDCGCFGGGGLDESVDGWNYFWHIVGDTALLAASLWLVVRPKTPFAVDNVLYRDLTPENFDIDEDTE